jgi:hypothetical protein
MAWTVRYVRADSAGGGDGTADTTSGATAAFTLAEAITHSTTNTNVQYNLMHSGGTFSNTTTVRTFSGAGTTSAPNWWRGNNTSLGDIESDNGLTKPLIDFTTGNAVISAAFQYFTNIRFNSAAVTGTNPGTVNTTAAGTDVHFWGCRFTNTGANANSHAMRAAGARTIARACFFSATSSAHCVVVGVTNTSWLGNVISAGNIGFQMTSGSTVLAFNVIDDPNSHGVSIEATSVTVLNNSVYSAGGDGIRVTSTGHGGVIGNNAIANSAGWGLNFSTGTNGAMKLFGNVYRSNTSGEVNQLAEDWRWGETSLGSDPFTDAAADDFSLASAAKALGLPGAFETQTYIGYLDPGAVQRQEPSGGGGTSVFLVEG